MSALLPFVKVLFVFLTQNGGSLNPSLCHHCGRIFKCFENTPESHTTIINNLASAEQQTADHHAA